MLWNGALSERITELYCSYALWFVLDTVLPATASQISLEQVLLEQETCLQSELQTKVHSFKLHFQQVNSSMVKAFFT